MKNLDFWETASCAPHPGPSSPNPIPVAGRAEHVFGPWLHLSEASRGAAGQLSQSSGTTLAGNAVSVTLESDGSCPDPASGFPDIKVPDHIRIARVNTYLVR